MSLASPPSPPALLASDCISWQAEASPLLAPLACSFVSYANAPPGLPHLTSLRVYFHPSLVSLFIDTPLTGGLCRLTILCLAATLSFEGLPPWQASSSSWMWMTSRRRLRRHLVPIKRTRSRPSRPLREAAAKTRPLHHVQLNPQALAIPERSIQAQAC